MGCIYSPITNSYLCTMPIKTGANFFGRPYINLVFRFLWSFWQN